MEYNLDTGMGTASSLVPSVLASAPSSGVSSSSTNPSSEVADFYSGRTIFITGGTGSLGTVLIAKLLDASPDIEKLYVLIRPKKSIPPQMRLELLLGENLAFERSRKSLGLDALLSKVRAVEGDIEHPGLGLSTEDESALVETVSVVFHTAATVRFDDELSKALKLNVGGTRSVLHLAKRMVGLKAFVHVSTAFAHCDKKVITERLYLDPSLSLSQAESTPGLDLSVVLGSRPNTYTYSKAMAEQMLYEEGGGLLPLAIIRPSVVAAALNFPFPGWVDNLNGTTSILAGSATGLLRTMYVKRECVADLVPVDAVINLMCAVAYKLGTSGTVTSRHWLAKEGYIPVFHCTSGSVNPILWWQIEKWGSQAILKYPLEKQHLIRYPGGSFKSSKFADRVSRIFSNWIPACAMDLGLLLCRKEPKLISITKKIMARMAPLEYFGQHEWHWTTDNTQALFDSLPTKGDREVFNFDLSQMDWEAFLDSYVLGTRNYALHNNPDSLEACRSNLRLKYIVHLSANAVVAVIVIGIILAVLAGVIFPALFPYK